jgi:hypothetical protein
MHGGLSAKRITSNTPPSCLQAVQIHPDLQVLQKKRKNSSKSIDLESIDLAV